MLLLREHFRVMGIKWDDAVYSTIPEANAFAIAGNAMHDGALFAVLAYMLSHAHFDVLE